MNDLISRQAAIDAVIKRDANCGIDSAEVLKALPSAQSERKKGRWILSELQWKDEVDNGNYRFICSECGKSDIHSKAVTVSFCWNCGADMREEQTDERTYMA